MLRVHLTGGDDRGWALDEDLRSFRAALQGKVEFVELRYADVIHSIYPRKLAKLPQPWLVGKKIICNQTLGVPHFLRHPASRYAVERTGLWIGRSREAVADFRALSIDSVLVPYAVDTSIFYPLPADPEHGRELRAKWSLPNDKYLIGNFHRDSEGTDLSRPKSMKGPDVLLEVVTALCRLGHPIHVLLAGPRRHYLRRMLKERGVPFTFVGAVTEEDDYPQNVLSRSTLNELYRVLDLCLVTSRRYTEGGPHAILEAAAARCKILSTLAGHAPDVLSSECVVEHPVDFVSIIGQDIAGNRLDGTLDAHEKTVHKNHTTTTIAPPLQEAYERLDEVAPFQLPRLRPNQKKHKPDGPWLRRLRRVFVRVKRKRKPFTVSLWNKFHRPPYGGGNQFLLALEHCLKARYGIDVRRNQARRGVDACVLNAVQFDIPAFERRHQSRATAAVLHRIDGPIHLYRGTRSRELDERTYRLNRDYAGATIVQSFWNLKQIVGFPYEPVMPTVVHNAVDPRIFHPNGRVPFSRDRTIRIIASSWSPNPRKGGATYRWLEEHLDWDRFDFTFVGNLPEKLRIAKHLPPMDSENLGDVLRQHDIYVAASRHDPCSNALVEALSCGLPALYYDDGGHPELVGYGGLPFSRCDDLPRQLDRLVASYEFFQNTIAVPDIADVAAAYLEILGELAEGQ